MGNERLAEQLKIYKLIEKKTGFKTTGAAACLGCSVVVVEIVAGALSW